MTYQRRDPRETTPESNWWNAEQKTREQELVRRKAHRERQARLIHVPPRTT